MRARAALAVGLGFVLIAAGVAFYVSSTSAGTLSVQIRDVPIAWAHLFVSFAEVSVHPASAPNGTGWIGMPLQVPQVDFLSLGAAAQVLALGRVAAGAYSAVRVLVSTASGVLASGAPVTLSITNGVLESDTSFLLRGGTAMTITLDLNLTASVSQTSAGWSFSPVLGPTQVG